MKLENGSYEEILFCGRNIHTYLSSNYDENIKLFIINDGEMFLDIQNNIIGKIDKNFTNIMVAAIESINRNTEYTPWYEEVFVEWVDNFGGEGDIYLENIITNIIPMLEEKINLKIKNRNKFIGGASLGGLISTYGVYEYPSEFAGGIFVSSSYWYQGFLDYLRDSRDINKDLIIYMDVGDREGVGKITYNQDVLELTKEVYNIFLNQGLKKENILFEIQEGMGHKNSFFIDRIYDGIEFIMGRIS